MTNKFLFAAMVICFLTAATSRAADLTIDLLDTANGAPDNLNVDGDVTGFTYKFSFTDDDSNAVQLVMGWSSIDNYGNPSLIRNVNGGNNGLAVTGTDPNRNKSINPAADPPHVQDEEFQVAWAIFTDDAAEDDITTNYALAVTDLEVFVHNRNTLSDHIHEVVSGTNTGSFGFNVGNSNTRTFATTPGPSVPVDNAFSIFTRTNGADPDDLLQLDGMKVSVTAGTGGPDPLVEWAMDGTGEWVFFNWDTGRSPNSNQTTALLGSVIQQNSTVINDKNVTVKGLTFDNANTYAVGGGGSLNLEADSGKAAIDVLQGAHEILQDVNLNSDTDATAASGASLNVNAHVSVNGNALSLAGDVFLNNGIDLGGGSVEMVEAVAVGGSADLDGGTLVVDPATLAGLAGSGDPLFSADDLSAEGLTLGGAAASLYGLQVEGNNVVVSSVPEPATVALVGLALAGLVALGRRRGALSLLAVVVICSMSLPSSAEAEVFRDDFDVLHDYSGSGSGGNPGSGVPGVPVGGIWDGIHNGTNGGDSGTPAYFVANGADFENNDKSGVLFIEDLNLHPNTDGALGVGWEGNKANAPFLFKEADAGKDFTAIMKINAETAGNWSHTALMARIKGPAPGRGLGDVIDDENFINTGSFRRPEANPDNATLNMQNIIQGNESATNQNIFPGGEGGAPLPVWVKLEKKLQTFTASMSLDGSEYRTNDNLQFENPAFVAGETMEIGLGHWRYTGSTGEAEIDFFEVDILDPQPLSSAVWDEDSIGDWNLRDNWVVDQPTDVNTNTVHVTLGSVITSKRSVYTDSAVTAKSLTFDNANQYTLTGTGSLTLEADSGNSSLNANAGSHEVQVDLNLANNTDSAMSGGARLDLNNTVDLGGNTLTVSGDGLLNFNNNLDSGTSGQVNSTGNVGGTGTINGGLANQAGGSVSPGLSVGELNLDGDYSQASTAALTIEIAAGGADLLAIDGTATLDGLLNVSLLDGFTPSDGTMFTVLTASSITDNGLSLGGPDASTFTLSVNADSVVLSVGGGLMGDYNNSGQVEQADLDLVLLNWGAPADPPPAGWINDLPTPEIIDQDELDGVLLNWGNSSSSVSANAVPEPSTLVFLLFTCAGLVLPRRHGRK